MRRTTLALLALGLVAVDRAAKLAVDGADLDAPLKLLGSYLQIIQIGRAHV